MITVRLNNPRIENGKYVVGVEMKSDSGEIVHGTNTRFWFSSLDFAKNAVFKNFAPGYAAQNPTQTNGNNPARIVLPTDRVNWLNFGPGSEQIYISGSTALKNKDLAAPAHDWTRIFDIELTPLRDNCAPPIVLDLEANTALGSFVPNSDGFTVTVYDALGKPSTALESVVQFNWRYTGNGKAPYGEPIQNNTWL